MAKANPQWTLPPIGDALAIFAGPDAYVTPSWYATKQETGKVVPTWNYVAVHAYGPVEFFQEPERLLEAVTRLTNKHEGARAKPWAVSDAPADFIAAQCAGSSACASPWRGSKASARWARTGPRPIASASRKVSPRARLMAIARSHP